MKVIRNFFDNQKPNFSPGGKREKYFPLYDVFENLFFLSKNKTTNPIHVRELDEKLEPENVAKSRQISTLRQLLF